MLKTSIPVCLDKELMSSAKHAAKMESRSAVQQVEYWARIGRVVSAHLKPADIARILAGSAELEFVKQPDVRLRPSQIFLSVESARERGELAANVTGSAVRYQVSERHPGKLEQIDEHGVVGAGIFKGGQFVVDTSDD